MNIFHIPFPLLHQSQPLLCFYCSSLDVPLLYHHPDRQIVHLDGKKIQILSQLHVLFWKNVFPPFLFHTQGRMSVCQVVEFQFSIVLHLLARWLTAVLINLFFSFCFAWHRLMMSHCCLQHDRIYLHTVVTFLLNFFGVRAHAGRNPAILREHWVLWRSMGWSGARQTRGEEWWLSCRSPVFHVWNETWWVNPALCLTLHSLFPSWVSYRALWQM